MGPVNEITAFLLGRGCLSTPSQRLAILIHHLPSPPRKFVNTAPIDAGGFILLIVIGGVIGLIVNAVYQKGRREGGGN